jgi:hypothetical protein
MRLVTYALEAATAKVGVLRNDKVLDLEKVLGISVPCMADAIGVLHGNAANLQKVMDHVSSSDESALVHNASLKAPILTPEKVMARHILLTTAADLRGPELRRSLRGARRPNPKRARHFLQVCVCDHRAWATHPDVSGDARA